MKKGNNIRWIGAMMIASELLLIGFTCNWIYSQYNKGKEQLTKDVRSMLVQITTKASDSTMFQNIVIPMMQPGADTEIHLPPPPPTINGATGAQKYKIVIENNYGPLDTAKMNERMAVIKKEIKNAEIKGMIANMSAMPGNSMSYHISSNDTGSDSLIKAFVPALLKQIIVQLGDSVLLDSLLSGANQTVKDEFDKKAKKNNWHFKTVWLNTGIKTYSGKNLTLHRTISKDIDTPKGLRIDNLVLQDYKGDIVRSISAQIGFAAILLLLTGASFAFAYRSLRKQMQLNTMKNDFISNMSHELKTPISTVKVALEALDSFNVIDNPETTREYIKMAGLEMNRLDMLVNKTLNTTMMEQGRITIQKEPVDLQQLIQDTLNVMALRLQQNNAKIQVSYNGTGFVASADKMHLQGVLINIIDNSLKYADKQPDIRIICTATAQNISIAIADNGPGIDPAYIKRVFEKFFRVPKGDTHNVKGYGLGLSYARQVVEQHGGTIQVHNVAEGGCVFTINIPKL
ncbi:MAG: sensor histidine kinase [Flavipsychrobacter sp.]